MIVTHMYQLAMDPTFEPMFTKQTPLQLEVVREPHIDENTQRTVHARTTGDESSNYNEVIKTLPFDDIWVSHA